MSNTFKFCSCGMCRAGRGTCRKRNHATTQAIMRKFRRDAKQALKEGREPDPKISVPYTD